MTEFERNKIETENNEQNAKHREPKNKFWKGVLVGSLVTAFCGIFVVALASGIWMVGRQMNVQDRVQRTDFEGVTGGTAEDGRSHQSAENEGGLDIAVVGAKLKGIEEAINYYYLFEGEETETDTMSAEDWIYTAYVLSFGDPYSSYYTAEDYKTLIESTEGEYCGVGVLVSQDVYTGTITVLKVFKEAPADVAGMLPGDIITAVEGMSVSGMDLSLVVNEHIKGEEGTDVVVTVFRESEGEYIDLTMTRAIVQNPTVEYEMLADNIGYINLSTFEDVSTAQFIAAVEDLEKNGMEALILDLRNNTGGVVTAAEAIADYILPDGKDIVSFEGKAVNEYTAVSKDGHQLEIPVVVLVNNQSASASEILSGALSCHDAATIVGTQTYGKGIAQGIFEIPDGSALKLTTAYYYLPSGECIHKKGIAPDVEVELKEELKTMVEIPKDEDNQLQAAIDVLLEGEEAVKARLEAEKAAAEESEAAESADAAEAEEAESVSEKKAED